MRSDMASQCAWEPKAPLPLPLVGRGQGVGVVETSCAPQNGRIAHPCTSETPPRPPKALP
jgi:hypothetical protein